MTKIPFTSNKEFQILILYFKYYMSCMYYEYWQTNLADDMIMLKICIWGGAQYDSWAKQWLQFSGLCDFSPSSRRESLVKTTFFQTLHN